MLSSAALGPVIGILPDGRDLAVRLRHKLLQLLLKELIGSLGCCGGRRCLPLGTGLLRLLTFPTAEIAGSGLILSLGLGLQALNGQIDLAIFIADDHHLHILALGQMLADVADEGVGHLRNMYHAGLIFRQGHKGAEIGDTSLDEVYWPCSHS